MQANRLASKSEHSPETLNGRKRSLQPAITVTRLLRLFMQRRHFIGQSVLVSAILDSKVHRSAAYQPTHNYSPKRRRDIAIGGEDGCYRERSRLGYRIKIPPWNFLSLASQIRVSVILRPPSLFSR